MNIKYLAFETNPINNGKTSSSFTQQGGSFIQEIEDRLRARAGNPAVNQNYNTEKKNKQTEYGTGISEEQIMKIIKEFKV